MYNNRKKVTGKMMDRCILHWCVVDISQAVFFFFLIFQVNISF